MGGSQEVLKYMKRECRYCLRAGCALVTEVVLGEKAAASTLTRCGAACMQLCGGANAANAASDRIWETRYKEAVEEKKSTQYLSQFLHLTDLTTS